MSSYSGVSGRFRSSSLESDCREPWLKSGEGFPDEIFVGMTESQKGEFECGICLQILRGAVECSNSVKKHRFCKSCLTHWLKAHKSVSSSCPECPVCSTPGSFTAPRSVNCAIQSWKVRCLSSTKTAVCVWTGPMKDFHLHDCYYESRKRQLATDIDTSSGQREPKRYRSSYYS